MSETDSNPKGPINLADIKVFHAREGERFGRDIWQLSSQTRGDRIGMAVEELLPGKQACPAHYHMDEEEHVLILEGSLTLLLGEARYTMTKDDHVKFPAGQEVPHSLINETDEICRYLVLSDVTPLDVIVYTDSQKIFVRATDEFYDYSKNFAYWDREKT